MFSVIIMNLAGDVLFEYKCEGVRKELTYFLQSIGRYLDRVWLVGYGDFKILVRKGELIIACGVIGKHVNEEEYYPLVNQIGEKFEMLYDGMREDIAAGHRKFDGFKVIVKDILDNFALIKDAVEFVVNPMIINLKHSSSIWLEYIFHVNEEKLREECKLKVLEIKNAFPINLVKVIQYPTKVSEDIILLSSYLDLPTKVFRVRIEPREDASGSVYVHPVAIISCGDRVIPISSKRPLEFNVEG